ncbi:MAG: HEAT repeat protein, partial [Planctomycetota bacterium]
MLALLLATVCGVCSTLPSDFHNPAPTEVVEKPGGKPLKALDAWMKLYKKGKIDYRSKRNIGSKESVAVKYKVRLASDLGNPTWSGDLLVILKATAELGTAVAAQAITEVAAVGIEDKGKYTYAHAPYSVRVAALEALATMSSKEAKDAVATGARGEWSKGRDSNSLRAAALLGLGYLGDTEYVPVVAAALADGHPVTRIHAVEALQRLGDEKAIRALIDVVERDVDDAVLVTAAKALRTIYSKFVRDAEEKRDREAVKKPTPKEGDDKADGKDKADDTKPIEPPPSARLAVRAAIKALGRTNWRAGMVLVRLLGDFRSSEAVPALISVLERYHDNPQDVVAGKLSGLLLIKAHELLVSMTGAVYSANQPAKWRELWDK